MSCWKADQLVSQSWRQLPYVFPLRSSGGKSWSCLPAVSKRTNLQQHWNPQSSRPLLDSFPWKSTWALWNAIAVERQYCSDKLVPCQVILSVPCGNQQPKVQLIRIFLLFLDSLQSQRGLGLWEICVCKSTLWSVETYFIRELFCISLPSKWWQ